MMHVEEEIVLRTAHDIRHLCVCARCGGLADDRRTVDLIPAQRDKKWHPKCFFDEFGEAGVLDLAHWHQAKFRICDIPLDLMKKLVDRA